MHKFMLLFDFVLIYRKGDILRTLEEIVSIVETRATELYGSTHKMLLTNGINRSIVGNMKRERPSIPNIVDFCKLADALKVSVDYLLNDNSSPYMNPIIDAKELIKDKLTTDERNIISIYREIDDDGKDLVQSSIREIWAEHRRPKAKSCPSANKNIG